MSWWHLKQLKESEAFLGVFYPSDTRRFLFGFTFNLFRESLHFAIFLVVFWLLLLAKKSESPSVGQQRRAAYACLACILVYEVFGLLVVEKVYLRFITPPLFFFTSFSLALFLQEFKKVSQFFILVVALVSLGFSNILPIKKVRSTEVMRPGIMAIADDFTKQGDTNEEVVIATDLGVIPSLVPFMMAIPVYSDYIFKREVHFSPIKELRREANTRYYFLTNTELPDRFRKRAKELDVTPFRQVESISPKSLSAFVIESKAKKISRTTLLRLDNSQR